ncbi:MAG: B12-binding domain-containing radical SAM protein [Candidatus Bathyarchaeota archaeon]|nr:B12-binding domain-containing radical SAM protein [Candidatus Bathyarchaeum sp.]
MINPPRIQPKVWGEPNVFQPVEIAYVAAVLEKQHKVSIIDTPTEGRKNLESIDDATYRVGLSTKDITDRIKRWSPDVVGINMPYSGWSRTTFELASAIKSVDKDIITVLDGTHPSARPADCLAHQGVDFVVIGEREQTTLELVGELEQGFTQDFKKIKGIAYLKDEKTVITAPRPKITDLDSLPFPARHLLPMSTYFDAVRENPLRGVIHKPWAAMMTSRGCPHECVFCSVHLTMGRQWRGRSPENVIEELEQLVDTYHIKQIDFTESNIALDKKRMENICDLIVEHGIDIEWYTPDGLRADTVDENLLRKMKRSGCKKIRIAPESGVQRVVNEVIKKNQDLKDVENALIWSKKVGIKVGCFFVMGFVGETKEDIKQTIDYAYKLRKLGADIFHFSIATPLYGTELYEQAKSGGFLMDNFNDEALAAAEPLIETPEFTAAELRELCIQANIVNQKITPDKIVKAILDPKKAIKMLWKR